MHELPANADICNGKPDSLRTHELRQSALQRPAGIKRFICLGTDCLSLTVLQRQGAICDSHNKKDAAESLCVSIQAQEEDVKQLRQSDAGT